MLTSLLLLLLPFTPAPQEELPTRSDREQRQLDSREQELELASQTRDAAYAALSRAYDEAEMAWVAEETKADALPPVIQAWMEEQSIHQNVWPARRRTLGEQLSFHDWWNQDLYRHSPAAAEYATAMAALEEAFMTVERLRHPERFAKGFDETPPGMVLVPTGDYPIGPHFGRIEGFPDSEKRRKTKLKAFYLDRSEVDCRDYHRFLLAQPDGLRAQHMPLDWELDRDELPVLPEGQEESPVVGISWSSAAAFARWAGKRLPNELEWEAAAAGLEGRLYARPLGFDAQRINCRATQAHGVRPVSDFTEDRTPLGILGLAGNAAEWTADLWLAPLQDGRRARSIDTPRAGAEAVVRGGSYLASAEGCRNTYRALFPAMGRAYRHIGFRCAQDLP
jgi:formylglycine-generating enzyme required for sulfatase activity